MTGLLGMVLDAVGGCLAAVVISSVGRVAMQGPNSMMLEMRMLYYYT